MTPPHAPSPAYVISRTARRDLAAIDDYTARHWGDAQARRYIAALWAAFDALAARPRLGRTRPGLPATLRLHKVGSHYVVYRRGPDGRVEIVRVLHQSMDLVTRLAAER